MANTGSTSNSEHYLLEHVAEDYFTELHRRLQSGEQISIKTAVRGLEQEYDNAIATENMLRAGMKKQKIRTRERITDYDIATLITIFSPVRNIRLTVENKTNNETVMLYRQDGPGAGIYTDDEKAFKAMVRQYYTNLDKKAMEEIYEIVSEKAQVASPHRDPDLIAVRNGLYSRKDCRLYPFAPEYAYLSKTEVDYVPDAENITFTQPDGTTWDVESWIQSLSDDPDIVALLWQIIAASIRPNTRWNKSVWLYSEQGNNGKGTFCSLIRNLCGPDSYTNISLNDFSEEFKLAELHRASVVISDENDVGIQLDKCKNLKNAVTGDPIRVNRKYKQPICFQFHGLILQCINDLPMTRDRTNSFMRRVLIVPMNKWFGGNENKDIKNIYLRDRRVLEYVQKRALEMDFDEFLEPKACTRMLQDYKETVNPVADFWSELKDEFVWDLLPINFLYDLYVKWHDKNIRSKNILKYRSFRNDLFAIVEQDENWSTEYRNTNTRHNGRLNAFEPLILQYDLTDWMNKAYSGNDRAKKCSFPKKDFYRGLVRIKP